VCAFVIYGNDSVITH